jgi:anti-sigma B factor antagonist
MKYSVDKQEKYALLTLAEENLNSLLAPHLKSEFYVMHNEGIPSLILDLSGVKFVDSSGLSAILTGNRLWKASGGSFVLTGLAHPSVKKLIEISRLDSILSIIPTIEEAVEFIFMEEMEREISGEE